jgi:uncharacterized protein (TIGR02271 family)
VISTDSIQPLLTGGGNVVDSTGTKIGTIGQVYLDDQTGEPEWVTAKTGLFGTSETFIPLAEASTAGADLRVPYTKDTVKDAPRVDTDGHLSQAQEAELYSYYGLSYTEATSDSGLPAGDLDRGVDTSVGYDTSGPTTDDAMTRSEEHLNVGTEKVVAGKARLRKYIVTEQQTVTVPVQREEVRLERVPVTEANLAESLDGPEITEAEHEVVLHEERAVVTTETVPVERVRLDTDVVRSSETVTEQVRKEVIETDGVVEGVVETEGRSSR